MCLSDHCPTVDQFALSINVTACCCAGLVNGVQSSLQNLFQSLSYVAGLILWQPQDFALLMYNSVAVVVFAAVLYSVFLCCCPTRRPTEQF